MHELDKTGLEAARAKAESLLGDLTGALRASYIEVAEAHTLAYLSTTSAGVTEEQTPRAIPTQTEMNQAFYIDVCRAEDRLKEFIAEGKRLLSSLPDHWHGEAETGFRDLVEETEAVFFPGSHHAHMTEHAIKRYGKTPTALEASRVVPARMTNYWHSVDTAPEDEWVILATSGEHVGQALMLADEDTGQQAWSWYGGDPVHPNLKPLGWRHMPSPLFTEILPDNRPGGFDGPTGAE